MKRILLVGLLAFISNVQAAIIELDATNSGYYTNLGERNGIESNIFAGTSGYATYRNWISFDLSGFTDEILSASLTVFNHSLNDDGISFTWSEVTSPLYEVFSDSGNGVAKFNDLGSGSVFASGVTDAGSNNEFVLNQDALLSLNNADSYWLLGGSTANDTGAAFGFTGGVGSGNLIRLTLETPVTAIPVPAAAWLFLSGLLGIVAVSRRQY